jgi:hypothetical protein
MKTRLIAAGMVTVGLVLLLPDLIDRFRPRHAPQATRATQLAQGIQQAAQASAPPLPAALPTKPLAESSANQLERATNLRALFERNAHDANGKNLAWRAWSACFPAFLGSDGQVATLEQVSASLQPSDPNYTARIRAWRNLQARCQPFFSLPHAQLQATMRQQQNAWNKGEALAPGELAVKYLSDGDSVRALAMAQSALTSGDAYALASLHEFVTTWLVLKNETQSGPPQERPDLRGLAFALVACQRGLECGPDSLTATLQCANTGQCQGGVAERHLNALSPADRLAAGQEATKLARTLQNGGSLGW